MRSIGRTAFGARGAGLITRADPAIERREALGCYPAIAGRPVPIRPGVKSDRPPAPRWEAPR